MRDLPPPVEPEHVRLAGVAVRYPGRERPERVEELLRSFLGD